MANDFSLQPNQGRLLFGSASIPVQCSLDFLVGIPLQRFSGPLVMQAPAVNQDTRPGFLSERFQDRGQVATSRGVSRLSVSDEECGALLSGNCWEEIFLIRGQLDYNGNVCTDTYLCLPPKRLAPACCAGPSGAVIFRLMFGSEPSHDLALQGTAQGKTASEVIDLTRLTCNEIPARRANDPGARIVELAANATRTRITSLMDCRAGWVLDDHDHPSDVLTFCVRGGGLLGIEDQSSPYCAGHLVVLPA